MPFICVCLPDTSRKDSLCFFSPVVCHHFNEKIRYLTSKGIIFRLSSCSGVNVGPPKDMSPSQLLELVNMAFFGKRVFTGVMKALTMRSPRIIQVDTKTMIGIL